MSYFKLLLIILGTLSLGIGIIGIAVPLLPTTPFLLITASLYVRSSDRLYQRLMSSKVLGAYIREFREEKGMRRNTKILSISLMWIMISISSIFFIESLTALVAILILGVIGTIVMGFIVPTANSKK